MEKKLNGDETFPNKKAEEKNEKAGADALRRRNHCLRISRKRDHRAGDSDHKRAFVLIHSSSHSLLQIGRAHV